MSIAVVLFKCAIAPVDTLRDLDVTNKAVALVAVLDIVNALALGEDVHTAEVAIMRQISVPDLKSRVRLTTNLNFNNGLSGFRCIDVQLRQGRLCLGEQGLDANTF